MTYSINTKFKEQLSSTTFNKKIKLIFGENCSLDGFGITVKNNKVSISDGKCIIEGACIESHYTDGELVIPIDNFLEYQELWICLQYNHVSSTIRETVHSQNPSAAYCLVIGKITKQSAGYFVELLNNIQNIVGINKVISSAIEDITRIDTTLKDFIENQGSSDPSLVEVVEARDGEPNLAMRLTRDVKTSTSASAELKKSINDILDEIISARGIQDNLGDRLSEIEIDTDINKNNIATNKNSIDVLTNTVDNIIEVPQLVSPKKFTIGLGEWVLDPNTGIYEYNLVHNLNLPKEAVQAKFFIGNEVSYQSFIFINNNSLKIFNDNDEELIVILGQFTEGNLYMKPEIDAIVTRIDSDIEKAESRIVELEDFSAVWKECSMTGSIKCETSIEAFTKDLVIKGKTVGGYNSETCESDNIVSSGEAEGNKIIVKSTGKNLFNGVLENGEINHSNGSNMNGAAGEKRSEFIWVKNIIALTVNKPIHLIQYSSDKTFIEYSLHTNPVNIINLESTTCYIRLHSAIDFANTMIEAGTVATSYEPYVENKIEVLLPMQDGLKSINAECDTLNLEEGKLVQKLHYVTLTGTEAWGVADLYDTDSCKCFSGAIPVQKFQGMPHANKLICNALKPYLVTDKTYDGECIQVGSDYSFFIKIKKSKLATQNVEGFKMFLQQNNLSIVYQLKNPIVHNISKLNLSTYAGVTNIIQENSVCGVTSFKFPLDRDAAIESLSNEIRTKADDNEVLKKDGSVAMKSILMFDNPDTTIFHGIGHTLGATVSVGNQVQLQNLNTTYPERNFQIVASAAGIYPNGDFINNLDVGTKGRPWKDVWVGDVSKSVNGYCKLTNGLIMQWGYRFLTTISTNWYGIGEIFPIAFPNGILNASVATHSRESSMQYGLATCGRTTSTSIFLYVKTENAGNIGVYYEAIGY